MSMADEIARDLARGSELGFPCLFLFGGHTWPATKGSLSTTQSLTDGGFEPQSEQRVLIRNNAISDDGIVFSNTTSPALGQDVTIDGILMHVQDVDPVFSAYLRYRLINPNQSK